MLADVEARHARGVDDCNGTCHRTEAGRIDELGVETGGAGRAFGEERHERAAARERGLCRDDGGNTVVIGTFGRLLHGGGLRPEGLNELLLNAARILDVDVGHGGGEARKGENVTLGKLGIVHVARHVHVHRGGARHGGHAAHGVEHRRELAPARVLRNEDCGLREVGVLRERIARTREELQIGKLGVVKEALDRQRGRGLDLHLMTDERDGAAVVLGAALNRALVAHGEA